MTPRQWGLAATWAGSGEMGPGTVSLAGSRGGAPGGGCAVRAVVESAPLPATAAASGQENSYITEV
jgi:hypothetical protein